MASQNGSKNKAAQPAVVTPAAQSAADRRAMRQAALAEAAEALASESNDKEHDALVSMVEAFTPRTRASGGPRVLLEKADPGVVAAYFEATGLTRKELAAAAGVSSSVIATVQNEKGDRWSAKTFEAKKAAIAAWATSHKAEIEARKAAEAADEARRKAEADAKAQRALARQQAAAAKAKPAPKAKAVAPRAKAAAKKPGRPSHSQRQANRRRSAAVAVQA